MECKGCEKIKLPNEFPPCTIAEECEHAPLFCLRCTIEHVEKTLSCPHPGCKQTVKEKEPKLELFQAMVDTMFKEYDECSSIYPDVSEPGDTSTSAGKVITISMLNGQSMQVDYRPSMTVIDLKKTIKSKTDHSIEKQKLLYNDLELENYKSKKKSCLSDYYVKPSTILFLVIRLYTIPSSLDEVVFDLYWQYPSQWRIFKRQTRDYLDASCFLYDEKLLKFLCDYTNQEPIPAVRHFGDRMDNKKKAGHHTIQVSLKNLPDDIENIFFSLSAWDSANISAFPSASLKFYKKDDPSNDLCKTTFNEIKNSQALLMCCVSRNYDGSWEIFELGKPSNGNASYYEPIYQQISIILRDGLQHKLKP